MENKLLLASAVSRIRIFVFSWTRVGLVYCAFLYAVDVLYSYQKYMPSLNAFIGKKTLKCDLHM